MARRLRRPASSRLFAAHIPSNARPAGPDHTSTEPKSKHCGVREDLVHGSTRGTAILVVARHPNRVTVSSFPGPIGLRSDR